MANASEISARYDPKSASDPADLSRQATKAWIEQASSSGVTTRQIAGDNSIGVVEANGELFSLDLRGDRVEAHKLNMGKPGSR